ncbi:putative vanillate transporter [Arthrobacter globiformis NBRC 12137]|uniref:Putative vanillate transporter n=1 Tax=Arthrobacter globiformis (strain ATCC 8010 / DSM 20124 / JCM 1332 / NBRC 12137 / NCIMB 8907 / NRRL B-2979 / 168) TaxID=1077972 RepID=H0QTA9_ARTG1|nr:MFS transporter [Arthrobacter globiformis]GAB16060.1 putative vanillate transporter [Arthrobacter globiformis NBRC 12137]
MELRERIRNGCMTGLQFRVVLICCFLAVLEGYEIIVMAFVAPTLATEWSLNSAAVGLLFSAGLLGMAIGATFLGGLADRIGRRNHILGCLLFGSLGMALTGMATDMTALVAFRAFAGIWLGAIVPSLNTLVSEFAPDRRRGTVMGIFGVGLPLGGLVGGLATGLLIETWGWHGPFFFTALLSMIMFLVVFFFLPESVEFLITKRPAGALHKYNRIAGQLGLPISRELPEIEVVDEGRSGIGVIFSGVYLRRTIFLWVGYVLLIATFYFANSWTPTLVAQATGNAADGRLVGSVTGVGGILGSLGFAALSARINPRLVIAGLMALGLPTFFAFAALFDTGWAMLATIFVGMVTAGGVVAFNAIIPHTYPTAVRGAAVGLITGLGRIVAILVPLLMGYWFAAGASPVLTFQLYGFVVLLAGICVFVLHRTYPSRDAAPAEDFSSIEPEQTQGLRIKS